MEMTQREEQIKYEAVIAAENQPEPTDYAISARADHFNGFVEGFAEGAAWSDANPGWISVKDKRPEHNEEENGLITFPEVLVCICDGYRTTDCYDDIREKWLGWNGEVEYWMPLPAPPKKG